MIKQMAVVTRRPDMTHQEYVDYVKHIHGYQITCSNPLTISKYIQNYVYDAAYGTKKDLFEEGYKIVYSRDSITELYFEDSEALNATFSDEYVRNVVGPDGANFNNLSTTLPLLVTEEEVKVPNPVEGGFKVYYFIKKNDSLSEDEFNKLWFESHDEIVNDNRVVRNQLRKFINNVPLSAGESDYFGSEETLSYDGIATMWFESTEAFRTYQRELALKAEEKENFIDQSRTFFLYTDALTIYEKKNNK